MQEETDSYQTDTIDLIKLFNSLLAKKIFIFGFTAFITLLAIIYTLNITPTYQVVSKFTLPSNVSIINLNKIQYTKDSKESVFSHFLSLISSQSFQKEVFIDGDFFAEFNSKAAPIDNIDQFVIGAVKSIKLDPPKLTKRDIDFDFLYELPYSISMQGSNVEAITKYLNELVAKANTKTIDSLIQTAKRQVVLRLDTITKERQLLLVKAKKERLNDIEIYTVAAKLARSLGIIENNFKLFNEDNIESNLTIAIGENHELPMWYLYGEKALLEKVEVLKSRINDEPFIPELITLDLEKLTLESNINEIDYDQINSMQLSQTTNIHPIKTNKRLILILAFIGSFVISILLALLMGALKPDEKNST